MAKDSPRTTAGELQKIVESQPGSEILKKDVQTAPTCCLGGFQEKLSWLIQKLQHIKLSDTTGISNGTDFFGKMKQKN